MYSNVSVSYTNTSSVRDQIWLGVERNEDEDEWQWIIEAEVLSLVYLTLIPILIKSCIYPRIFIESLSRHKHVFSKLAEFAAHYQLANE